jgi:anti-sigma regulatory factor (Ser/Thr protein kinase)
MGNEVDETTAPDALQLLVPADPGLLAGARQRIARWLGELGVASDDRFGIVLACSEAVAIAIERVPASGAIAVDISHVNGTLTARVRDFTPWTGPARSPDRVRRLLLIARLTDWFDVGYTPGGGEVRLAWKPQQLKLAELTPAAREPQRSERPILRLAPLTA